ncbi:MAG TPA: M15 family metallopeptidase [Thermoanaerobaculia bacterium]|jgi:peptidoglycan L-alanyl-D-glutamate endopeptidase CwlK|nr:M15 family metallopeptidase [Thermoanaerobaculia bacterium]
MASRRLEDLVPEVQEMAKEHILRCADAGFELLIYCTLRDAHEQSRLYRQSRTKEQVQKKIDQLTAKGFPGLAKILKDVGPQKSGPKVTNAGPGESFHQYNRAYDCVPVVQGKPIWSPNGEGAALWEKVGKLGKKCGLEWAGEWTTFREFPHFQFTDGKDIEDLMQERFGTIPAGAVGLAGPMMAGSPESDALRGALDEANTVFLVFGNQAGVNPKEVRKTFDLATLVAKGLFPEVWRTFLVQDPASLDQDLGNLLWPGGDTSPAVLLKLGTGLNRQRGGGFRLDQLSDATAIAEVFSKP